MAKNTVPQNMILQNEFDAALQQFAQTEAKGSFYGMFINLVKDGFEVEAAILILATWNFGRFRYAIKNFYINHFIETIKKLRCLFKKIENERFKKINFDVYKQEIKTIYETLSKIKGVEYTGASKIMHITNPYVFVMWDEYIRGQKTRKYYKELDIFKKGYWCCNRYNGDAESYFQFLKDMQVLFQHITFPNDTKKFAKAIDEYNFINITMPIQKMEQKEKMQKKNSR